MAIRILGSNNLFSGNRLTANGNAIYITHSSDNTLANNTLVSANGESIHLYIDGYGVSNNTFCWNNFTDTGGQYVHDLSGNNFYNGSICNGEGNIYANVINKSVPIIGASSSLYGEGLYVGSVGPGYPYDGINSLNKMSGAIDYAPLTMYNLTIHFGNLSVNTGIGGTANGSDNNFIVPANKNISASANLDYLFVNWVKDSGNCTITAASNPNTTVEILSGNCVVTAKFNAPSDRWWNMTWKYRRQINLTNWSCAFSYCQYPINLNLYSSATNGSDIRVINELQDAELSFWREDGNWSYANALGKLWVNASNGTSKMYIYYGANGASDKSNCDATFPFCDTFTGSSVNTSKWSGDTERGSVTNGLLAFSGDGTERDLNANYANSGPYSGISAVGRINLSTIGCHFGFNGAWDTNGSWINQELAEDGMFNLVNTNDGRVKMGTYLNNRFWGMRVFQRESNVSTYLDYVTINTTQVKTPTASTLGIGAYIGGQYVVADWMALAWMPDDVLYINIGAQTSAPLLPAITSISVAPAGATMENNLYCNLTASTLANSTMNVTISWNLNGIAQPELAATYTDLANNTATTVSSLASGNLSAGQNWSCSAMVFDGNIYSEWNTSANLTIANIVPYICGNLGTSNRVYTMNNNISISGSTCFNITAANVTLDCNGFSIVGNNANNAYGVYSNRANTTIKNCAISSFMEGISITNATNSTIQNNTVRVSLSGTGKGIRVAGASSRTNVTANTIMLMVGNSSGVYVDNGTDIVVDCRGASITAPNMSVSGNYYGVYLAETANSTVKNCNITEQRYCIFIGGMNNIASNNTVKITSGSGYAQGIRCGGMRPICANNTISSNAMAMNVAGAGAVIERNSLTGTSSVGTSLYIMANNVIARNNRLLGVYVRPLGLNNLTFYNNYVNVSGISAITNSGDSVIVTNSTFYNNTLIGTTVSVVRLFVNASRNTFYWNNFSSTTGAYITDTGGSNFYNATINGKPEGNIYKNVINGSINVTGLALSGYGSGLYIGSLGAGYPYNSSTSSGKFACNSTGCADYAPLTFQQIYLLVVSAFPVNGGNVSGSAFNLAYGTARNISVMPNTGYIFGIWNSSSNDLCPITCSDCSNTSVTVYSQCNITALFTKTYSLTLSTSPRDGGNVFGEGSNIPAGTYREISAVPNPGYVFQKWTMMPTLVSAAKTDGPCKIKDMKAANTVVVVNGNCGLQALFNVAG